jgi:single-strand DNA-binding protein
MLNKVTLIGSCGKDPESRFFPSGDRQVTISLATSERWKDKQSGERKEKTSWHNLAFNGKLADIVDQYVKKGSKIYVEGKIDYQEWEKDGVKKYMTRIVVDNMVMLDSKSEGQAQSSAPSQQQAPAHKAPANDAPYDDDIPF